MRRGGDAQNGPMRLARSAPPGSARAPGLVVLVGLVAVGMGIPAYLRWAVPRLEARRDAILAAAPTEPIGRLARWFEYGQPRLHEALVKARFSSERPWFVTHVVAPRSAQEPPEIWGIDLADLPIDVVRLEGLSVVVALPAPERLARDVLVGDRALGVPVFPADGPAPDGRELAERRLERYLGRVGEALEKDIEGARLVVEVGGPR